jgi:hypothetical protein
MSWLDIKMDAWLARNQKDSRHGNSQAAACATRTRVLFLTGCVACLATFVPVEPASSDGAVAADKSAAKEGDGRAIPDSSDARMVAAAR